MLSEQSGIQVDKFYPPTDWQYSFPEGYTRLEYLQFTGTQYIELNFKANQDTRVITEVSFSKINTNQIVFSSRDTKTSNTFSCVLVGGQKIRADYNTTRIQTVAPIINTYHKIDFNKNNFYINNNLEHTFNYTNFQSSYNMTIGVGLVSGATPESYLIGNLKQTIIFDNGTLVFNLVPVKRNSDNKPGMYDLVNDVFYVNQGTNEFVMGSELYLNNSQIDIRQKNNTNFVEKYKFNENNELVWANPNLYLTGKVNYTKVGSPTIVDNVASGFSSSNYIANNNTFNITSNFEICVKINSWGNINTVQNFCSLRGNVNLNLRFDATGTIINGVYGSSSTQWNNIATNLTVGLPTTIKVSGNGTNITITTIQNGVSQSSTKTISELGLNGNYTIYYGRGGTTVPFTSGYIDLKETYIKVNNKLWFYGKNYTSENYAPVPAGLNYNNTTTPSIGYVNTQTQEFIPAPMSGVKYSQTRDIKVIPPEDNTITLLYGVASDFSKYSLFGLLANVSSGTYDVYIDDVLYATTASATQTDIDFSALGSEYVPIGTYTTPEELVLHKIVIKPTTSGETLTAFRCRRTSGASGTQAQGCLWVHLELKNNIALTALFNAETTTYTNNNLYSVTAKNNTLRADLSNFSFKNTNVVYLPYIIHYSSSSYGIFTSVKCKRIKVNITGNISSIRNFLTEAIQLEKLDTNISTQNKLMNTTNNYRSYKNTYKLKQLPCNKFNTLSNVNEFVISNTSLYPTKLDISDNKDLTILGTYGTSTYPMRGIRGLKVSNEAPFTGTSPQINVSYTGLGRDELVELFNSMPGYMPLTKVGNPTITDGVVSGFSGSDYLVINETFSLDNDTEFIFDVFLPTNNTTQNACFLSLPTNTRIQFYRSSVNLNYFVINIDGQSSSGTHQYSLNANHKIKVIITKTTISLYYYDNNQWIFDMFYNVTNDSISNAIIGRSQTSDRYFYGSININNSYMKINNARYQFQLPDDTTSRAINITAASGNNLTKVGTPTIDENGVASGFSYNKYLYLASSNLPAIINNFEIQFNIAISAMPTIDNYECICGQRQNQNFRTPQIEMFDNKCRIIISPNGSSWITGNELPIIDINTQYWIKFIYKNNELESLLSTNGKDFISYGKVTVNNCLWNADLCIGTDTAGYANTHYFKGSIDLENTYIKVGQNYFMKGYLLDSDRAIVTNKGWTITG